MDTTIAGALYDFLGYLTTRETAITLSGHHTPHAALDALHAWAELRGLDLADADVQGWQDVAKRPVSASEAGRRGGNAVKAAHGADYYSEMGRKGGAAVAKLKGPSFYSEIGRQGGAAVRDKHGVGFYRDIGRMGGEALKNRRGPDYYSAIGAKGGAAKGRNTRPRDAGPTSTGATGDHDPNDLRAAEYDERTRPL